MKPFKSPRNLKREKKEQRLFSENFKATCILCNPLYGQSSTGVDAVISCSCLTFFLPMQPNPPLSLWSPPLPAPPRTSRGWATAAATPWAWSWRWLSSWGTCTSSSKEGGRRRRRLRKGLRWKLTLQKERRLNPRDVSGRRRNGNPSQKKRKKERARHELTHSHDDDDTPTKWDDTPYYNTNQFKQRKKKG